MRKKCFLLLWLIGLTACFELGVNGQGKCETDLSICKRNLGATQGRLNSCAARERNQKKRADDAELLASQYKTEGDNQRVRAESAESDRDKQRNRADSAEGQVRQLQSDFNNEKLKSATEKGRADKAEASVRQLNADLSAEKTKLANETTRANGEKTRADTAEIKIKQLNSDLSSEKTKSASETARANNEKARADKAEAGIKELEKNIPKVVIEKVWVEHNIKKDTLTGMIIHIKFTAYNLLNSECRMAAYFYTKDGVGLIDKNNAYNTANGKVSVGADFKPAKNLAVFEDYQVFMPYDELHQTTGKYELKFSIRPYRASLQETEFFSKSEDVNFNLTVP